MSIFSCKHDWKVLSETTTESPFEVAAKMSMDCYNVKIPWQMCQTDRKHIVIVSCNKCGCIKKFVEDLK
mgnify:FL=1